MSITLQAVLNQLTEPLKQEIITFWVEAGALSPDEAEKRVSQALILAREGAGGPIIGICTAYERYVEQLGFKLYAYRNFNRADHRSEGIAHQLFHAAFGLLEGLYKARGNKGPCGLLIEIENDWLKARDKLVWTDVKNMTFIGYGANGAHLRLAYFADARIPPPEPKPH